MNWVLILAAVAVALYFGWRWLQSKLETDNEPAIGNQSVMAAAAANQRFGKDFAETGKIDPKVGQAIGDFMVGKIRGVA